MYLIAIREIAAEEMEEAIRWYAERSVATAERFVQAMNHRLDSISENPYQYGKQFKSYREARLKKFPYSIVYLIDEPSQKIVIVAIYHQKRNPKNKYRK